MTNKTDNMKNKVPVSAGKDEGRVHDGAVNARRALLKGAIATMPMILTLQSGAALARSSNLITASRPRSAKDAEGRTLCMDYNYVDTVYGADNVADLGEPPYAHITAIRKDIYFDSPDGEVIRRWRMCREGGVFFTKKDATFYETDYVPKGMLVSATALSSFAGHIDITEL